MTDEPFLSRWSRLKRKAVEPPPPPAEERPVAVTSPDVSPAEPAAEAEQPDDPLADLPRIEDLTGESDFTPFLKPGVPDDLHRQALRKLWTSDPIYANDDGLKDYAGDYTGLFDLTEPVKTLYRVGQGFLDAIEDGEATPPAADPAVPPAVAEPAEEADKLSHPETGADQDRTK